MEGRGGTPFIDIWNCQAAIAREVYEGRGITVVYAKNSEALTDEIMQAILDQDGAINMSGRMACPPELAAKAVW